MRYKVPRAGKEMPEKPVARLLVWLQACGPDSTQDSLSSEEDGGYASEVDGSGTAVGSQTVPRLNVYNGTMWKQGGMSFANRKECMVAIADAKPGKHNALGL